MISSKELLSKFDLATYIAFDFETTGLSPENDRIIEIAAIKFEDGTAVDRFVHLVNPERPIDSLITEITGISNAMVSDAPVERNIVDHFLDFLEDLPLVAHNIAFDCNFLKHLCDRYNKEFIDRPLYDTLLLARIFLYFHPTHSLGSVSEFFNLSAVGSHRAETDTENTGIIFQHLVHEAASYPLEVFSKIIALAKSVTVNNKQLFINIANELKLAGKIKSGLVQSKIKKPIYRHMFTANGKSDFKGLTAQDVFGKFGRLSNSLTTFEHRITQQEYCAFVQSMLNTEQSYCAIEAGTGLGKSMAYLFPALQKAFDPENEFPVIISCHTKHLQDQLFNKDLPLLAQALDVPFHTIILKGRNNYICLTRLSRLIADAAEKLNSDEIESILPLFPWLQMTETGDLSECAGFWGTRPYRIAEMIQSEPGFCTTTFCSAHNGCYFGPVRQAVRESQIIIINHALLISNLNNPGLLPPFETVIIDEAHNLVDTAYEQLSIQINMMKINSILDIIDPSISGSKRWTIQMEQLADHHAELKLHYKPLAPSCKNARNYGQTLFDELTRNLSKIFKPEIFYSQHNIIQNLNAGYGSIMHQIQEFELSLSEVDYTLKNILDQLDIIVVDHGDFGELQLLFENGAEAIATLQKDIAILTHDAQNGWIYWQQGQFKQARTGEKILHVSMNGAPIDISDTLADTFFNSVNQCILTSATLRVEESFEYILNRTGMSLIDSELVHTAEFHSPFYYEDQVKYYQYSGKNGQNPELVADLIYTCHRKYEKRIMALFTSRNSLHQVYMQLLKKPRGRKLPLFAQISGSSRYALLRGLHRTRNGILIGTNAFWEGVDLPRDLLEILIICKLPFSVPSDPLVKAYSNLLDQQGSNSFMEFSVPEAVIRFRQGFGRLIRTVEDEGIFIVMDERIVQKRYGPAFSDTIPVRMQTFEHISELVF